MGYIKGSTKLLLCQVLQGKVRNGKSEEDIDGLFSFQGVSMYSIDYGFRPCSCKTTILSVAI